MVRTKFLASAKNVSKSCGDEAGKPAIGLADHVGVDLDEVVGAGLVQQGLAGRLAAAVADLQDSAGRTVQQQRDVGLHLLGGPQVGRGAGDVDAVDGDHAVTPCDRRHRGRVVGGEDGQRRHVGHGDRASQGLAHRDQAGVRVAPRRHPPRRVAGRADPDPQQQAERYGNRHKGWKTREPPPFSEHDHTEADVQNGEPDERATGPEKGHQQVARGQ